MKKLVSSPIQHWHSNQMKYFILLFLLLSSCTTSVSFNQSASSSLIEDENNLIVQATLKDISGLAQTNLVFQFYTNNDFTGSPDFEKVIPVDLTSKEGDVEELYTFVSLTEGSFYLKTFLYANSNGTLDAGEKFGTYVIDDESKKIEISEKNKQAAFVTLNQSE